MYTICNIPTNCWNYTLEKSFIFVIQMLLKCNKTVIAKYYKILYNERKKEGTKENANLESLDTLYIYIYIYRQNLIKE